MTLPLETANGAAWLASFYEGLEGEQQEVLSAVRELMPECYLVGGTVRDLLLGRPGRDLDLVSLSPVGPPARTLMDTFGGSLTSFEPFLTCSLTLPSGVTLDLATARREHYPHHGALPVVAASDLAHDLYRRDFSVNTFALSLSPPHDLTCVEGAQPDLREQRLRVLHERSFFDDPTRIVRGARLAGRLEFSYDTLAAQALGEALEAGAHRSVSLERLKNELLLSLDELKVAPVITNLNAVGALHALYGLTDTPLLDDLDDYKVGNLVPAESYLLALLLALSDERAATFVTSFGFPRGLLSARTRLLKRAAPRTPAEAALAVVLYPESSPSYLRVRGSDVLSLGLPAGPEVGVVLRELERARLNGEVASFADELELANRLVGETLRENA